MPRPDFIIIGGMKCATSTLHEQLARQGGIFMTSPKEPCFFSDDEQWERGHDWYDSLFAGAQPNDVCGESSTHYTKLPTYPKTIDRMAKTLGMNVRFIYIMRHPIERLISQYIHEWSQGTVSCTIDEAIHVHPELIAYSEYARQLEPYFNRFGRHSVLPVFFTRLRSHPQEQLQRVCRFIGHCKTPRWSDEATEQNVSRLRERKSALRDALKTNLIARSIIRMCIPGALRERVRDRLWRMPKRPELSPDSLNVLRERFDKDLSTLGRWLALDLSCEVFDTATDIADPAWHADLNTSNVAATKVA